MKLLYSFFVYGVCQFISDNLSINPHTLKAKFIFVVDWVVFAFKMSEKMIEGDNL